MSLCYLHLIIHKDVPVSVLFCKTLLLLLVHLTLLVDWKEAGITVHRERCYGYCKIKETWKGSKFHGFHGFFYHFYTDDTQLFFHPDGLAVSSKNFLKKAFELILFHRCDPPRELGTFVDKNLSFAGHITSVALFSIRKILTSEYAAQLVQTLTASQCC